jgi:hypothetical protein
MLGSEANVHFQAVTPGSACCRAIIDPTAAPKIRERAEAIVLGTAPKSAMKAHAEIDDLLALDNAIGSVVIGNDKAIEFPGRRRATREKFGPVRRATTIEGQIFSIGGKDDTINVQLRDKGEVYRCEVSIELARKLATRFLLGKVRLFGHGEWFRVDSKWTMASFTATDFETMDERSLHDTLASVRDIFAGSDEAALLASVHSLREG